MGILDRLTPVFRDVFGDPSLVVTPALNTSQVPNWDSLNHINLVLAIEEEFGLQFTTEELVRIANVEDLVGVIQAKQTPPGAPEAKV